MILYSLACDVGHRFESWFRDSAAYDDQAAGGLVSCPTCRSTEIAKAIMAPAIVGARLPAGETPADIAPVTMRFGEETGRALRELIRGFRQKLLAEADNVGARFAVEARRMHEGEVPLRQIYGQASPDEAHDLLEDGIPILPMPITPDELN